MAKIEKIDLRGRFYSLDELASIRSRYARIANQRLRALEKAGRDYWAYDTATLYTQRAYGTNRFKTGKWKGNKEGLVHELEELQDFLTAESSTVSGSRRIEDRIVNTFSREHNIQIQNRREFFNFLSSATYKAIANNGISSGMIIDFYVRSREIGKTISDIEQALSDFRTNKVEGIRELYDRSGISVFDTRYTNTAAERKAWEERHADNNN